MHFVKLHQLYDAEKKERLDPVFINLEQVHSIKRTDNKTYISFQDADMRVIETPEEVLRAEVQNGCVMYKVL